MSELLPLLYLTGDFREALPTLLGENASGLQPSSHIPHALSSSATRFRGLAMRTSTSMSALFVIVAMLLFGVPAVDAQSVAPGARPPTLEERLLLREQWARHREHERSQIRIGGPIVGVVAGAALLGTFAWLATRNDDGRKVGVALGIVVGLPMTVISSAILAKRVKKRRAIAREIWSPPR